MATRALYGWSAGVAEQWRRGAAMCGMRPVRHRHNSYPAPQFAGSIDLPPSSPSYFQRTSVHHDAGAEAIPLATVLDLLLDAVCVVDAQGRFVFVSAAGEAIFGYTPEELKGRQMIDLVYPPDRPRTLQRAQDIMDGTAGPHFENRYLRKDGQVVTIMWSARWSAVDGVRVAVARDVTGLRRAEAVQPALLAISEAAHTAEDLPALFARIHQIIGELLPANNFFVAIYDEANDALSFPYFVDQHDDMPATQSLDAGSLTAEVIRTGQPLLLTPDADPFQTDHVGNMVGQQPMNWLGTPLESPGGIIGALVVQSYSIDVRYTAEDLSLLHFVSSQVAAAIMRKQTETRLRYLARHDTLTDLPNRELFQDRLQAALVKAQRHAEPLSLLYIDVDRFKQVNDTFGHAAGDLLLREVAQRIKGCIRESDTVGRVGGDEFVVLLITPPQFVATIAEKIRVALDRTFGLDEDVHVSASIGIAQYPEHGADEKQLMRHADAAMYVAKEMGGNQFR